MKKVGLVGLLLVLLFSLAGCAGGPEDQAKQSVETYLKDMKNGDTKEAEKYLNADSTFYDVFSYKYVSTLKDKSDEQSGDTFTFLYDMHIATEGGDDIHRKVEIKVEKYVDQDPVYEITDVTIRENFDDNNNND